MRGLDRSEKRLPDSVWEAFRAIASRLTPYALLVLAGCAIPVVPYRAVYEDPVNYVRLELDDSVLPEWPPSAHAHPRTIEVEDMARILRSISVKEHRVWLQKWLLGEAPLIPVFLPEELALLSRQISEAFALARPNERVTFYLSQPRTSVKRLITTGGVYIHGTELHFILGNWQVIYGIPTYGMIYDRRYPMRPTAAKGFYLYFNPADATIPQQNSLWDTLLANKDDELIIDLTKTLSAPVSYHSSP